MSIDCALYGEEEDEIVVSTASQDKTCRIYRICPIEWDRSEIFMYVAVCCVSPTNVFSEMPTTEQRTGLYWMTKVTAARGCNMLSIYAFAI